MITVKMKSFLIIFAACLAAASADSLYGQQFSCQGTTCTGSITYGKVPQEVTLYATFFYNWRVPLVTSTVLRGTQEPAQIIYSHERVANGTTTQCVALLNQEDTLCVSFLATYNSTNADVQLNYYAKTQSSGQVTSGSQKVIFTTSGSSYYNI